MNKDYNVNHLSKSAGRMDKFHIKCSTAKARPLFQHIGGLETMVRGPLYLAWSITSGSDMDKKKSQTVEDNDL